MGTQAITTIDLPKLGRFTFRPAEERDLPAIVDLYNHYVLNDTSNFQEHVETVEDAIVWLKEQNSRNLAVIVAVKVDEHGNEQQLAGATCLNEGDPRCGRLVTEGSIYIHRDFVGCGLGKCLNDILLNAARARGFHSMIIHITAENTASLALVKKAGFREVGVLKEMGSKFGRLIDVTILQIML